MMGDEQADLLIAWVPDLIYFDGRFESGTSLVCNSSGRIERITRVADLKNEKRIQLTNRALLPGMVNAHSHAFQRVLRGRSETRSAPFRGEPPPPGSAENDFWTWRELMYSAASRLTAEDIYDASRMAFLEMALGGITAVGEFHYLHHAPDGTPYDDPNLLAKEVVRAANDVGLRIALLRVAYARAGFQTEPNPHQARFIEGEGETYLRNLDGLISDLGRGTSPAVRDLSSVQDAVAGGRALDTAWAGVAPHSVRAVPLAYLREVITRANEKDLKIHMHVAEQPAEVSACVAEYGRTPFALLQTEGLLSERFTAVHAIHVTPKAIASFARTGAMVCACPNTERNLGDGVVPADEYFKHDVAICLGTDSHGQIDLLEDARGLEYHLRLQRLERAVLGESFVDGLPNGPATVPAARLFECATKSGASSIGAPNGSLTAGKAADFFTVDLNDPSIAGAPVQDLLSSIVFSLSRAAVREVVIGGQPVVAEGQHLKQEEIVERFGELQRKLWS